jgi:hypothetical protein
MKDWIGDLLGILAIYFLLWAGLWAAHIFGS